MHFYYNRNRLTEIDNRKPKNNKQEDNLHHKTLILNYKCIFIMIE